MKKPILTHARHTPELCRAPNLFISLPRKGERGKLDVVYEPVPRISGESPLRRLEFSGPDQLGIDELRVIVVLEAKAAIVRKGLPHSPKTPEGKNLRALLTIEGATQMLDRGAMVIISYAELAREIGLRDDGGKTFRRLRDCIERLFKVTVIVQVEGKRYPMRLLSAAVSNAETGLLTIGLHPLIATAIFGGQHNRIPFAALRILARHNTATAILHRLCGVVDPGDTDRRISTRSLTEYAFGFFGDASKTAMSMRKKRVRQAMRQIEIAAGWKAVDNGDFFEISRPKLDLQESGNE